LKCSAPMLNHKHPNVMAATPKLTKNLDLLCILFVSLND